MYCFFDEFSKTSRVFDVSEFFELFTNIFFRIEVPNIYSKIVVFNTVNIPESLITITIKLQNWKIDRIYYILVLIYDKVFSQIFQNYLCLMLYVIYCSTSVSVQVSLLISDKVIWQKKKSKSLCAQFTPYAAQLPVPFQ